VKEYRRFNCIAINIADKRTRPVSRSQ